MRGYDFSGLTCLVVDDSRLMGMLLTQTLNSIGIERVFTCGKAQEAIEVLRANDVDLVFLDWEMAGLDGIELLASIRKGDGGLHCRMVPVIMVTAKTAEKDVRVARDAGVTEFLAKPFSAESIVMRLITVVEKPRPFIKAHGYFGPDRRRGPKSDFDGPFQRYDDHDLEIVEC